jgi:hypothetical protein
VFKVENAERLDDRGQFTDAQEGATAVPAVAPPAEVDTPEGGVPAEIGHVVTAEDPHDRTKINDRVVALLLGIVGPVAAQNAAILAQSYLP